MIEFATWPWQHWAKQRAGHRALIIDKRELTWAEVITEVNQRATNLVAAGVNEGDGVALQGKNSAQLLLNYLAVLQVGGRVLPLNPQLPAAQLNQLLPQLDILYFWNNTDSDCPKLATLTQLTEAALSSAPLVNCQPHWASWEPLRAATLTLTSGSTGLPKGVVHSIDAHLANAAGLLECMDFTASDSWLLSLPLFHVSGQGILWRWLVKGATLVVRSSHSLSESLVGCTHASLVPTQLWRLLSQSASTVHLKQVLLGGAMIPSELVLEAKARGICCWCGYGMTEMASTAAAKEADGLSGVGQILPGRELKIDGEEICLRGAGLSQGYWREGRIEPITDSEGWFRTRDRGAFIDGELVIQGRLDNQFFSGGEGIQPEDIERLLVAHPDIEQAFVVPVADSEFGHRPVVILQATKPLSLGDIHRFLTGKLPKFQFPDAVYCLPEVLAQGGIKISRRVLIDWVEKQK